MNELHHVALTRALDQLASPVELRSVSKSRIAWQDVEFWRDDVIQEWPHASDAAKPNEAEREPRLEAAGATIGESAALRLSTKGPAPLSIFDLRLWYERRIAQLIRRGETSSGEDDWTAAKQEFGGRVIKQVTMTSLLPNSPGDGRGHGTFVASIAAGAAKNYAGAAPTAKLLSIDVTDDNGMAYASVTLRASNMPARSAGDGPYGAPPASLVPTSRGIRWPGSPAMQKLTDAYRRWRAGRSRQYCGAGMR